MIDMALVQNLLAPFCCVLGKDTSWFGWRRLAVLSNIKLKHKFKRDSNTLHLPKPDKIIAYPMYSASVAFLRVRKINIETKFKKIKYNDVTSHQHQILVNI